MFIFFSIDHFSKQILTVANVTIYRTSEKVIDLISSSLVYFVNKQDILIMAYLKWCQQCTTVRSVQSALSVCDSERKHVYNNT